MIVNVLNIEQQQQPKQEEWYNGHPNNINDTQLYMHHNIIYYLQI